MKTQPKTFFGKLTRLAYGLGVTLLLAGMILSVVAMPVSAKTDWDKSSLSFNSSFGCKGDCGEATAKVCNVGDGDMAGSTSFDVYYSATGNPKNGSNIGGGTIPAMKSGECTVISYPATQGAGNYMFRAVQRAGHPGAGELWSDTCSISGCTTPTTPVVTVTPTETPVVTLTPTETPVVTVTPTETPVVTETPTETPVVTQPPTETPTETPVVTETPTETPVVTQPPTETPTETPVVTETPTETPVVTQNPSETPVVTETPTETPVVTQSPSETPVVTETPTETPVVTQNPSETPVVTQPPSTSTPNSGSDDPRTPLPTLQQPAGQPQVLIPVTGSDFSSSSTLDLNALQSALFNLGLATLGLAIVLHTITRRLN